METAELARPTFLWLRHMVLIASLLGAGCLAQVSPNALPAADPATRPLHDAGSSQSSAAAVQGIQPETGAWAPVMGPALVNAPDGATAIAPASGPNGPEPAAFMSNAEPVLLREPATAPLVVPASAPSGPLPVPAPLRFRDTVTLPILMFHYVDDLPRGVGDAIRRDLTVSTTSFRQQLTYLAANNVRTVSLDALMAHFRGGDPLPQRAAVLTFDDGYEDNYRNAYPLLRQFGMTGTFFVVTNLVGKPGYMTWAQLREMELNGMSIQSHSLDHVDLAGQPRAELVRQLTESRRMLQEHLVRPVLYLCYPSGRYNATVVAAARAAGYEAATTINHGQVQSRSGVFELNRVRVRGADTVDLLAARMVPPDWKYTRGTFGR